MTKNVAHSVRDRLLELSKQRGEEFNFVLLRYGLERLLYRLTRSVHADQFVLKGAMMFTVWSKYPHRATKDLDLLGYGSREDCRRFSERLHHRGRRRWGRLPYGNGRCRADQGRRGVRGRASDARG